MYSSSFERHLVYLTPSKKTSVNVYPKLQAVQISTSSTVICVKQPAGASAVVWAPTDIALAPPRACYNDDTNAGVLTTFWTNDWSAANFWAARA